MVPPLLRRIWNRKYWRPLAVMAVVGAVGWLALAGLPSLCVHVPATFPQGPGRRGQQGAGDLRPSPSSLSGHPVNYLEDECELCEDGVPPVLTKVAEWPVRDPGQEEALPLYRHYLGFEPWTRLQIHRPLPGQVPPTVHYVWCKSQGSSLGFHHYLGVLSVLRHLQPLKVLFHYTTLPTLDQSMYYTWFQELKQSLPSLVLRQLPPTSPPCGSPQFLQLALSLLQQDGGILLGSNVILSRPPHDLARFPFWFAFSPNGSSSSNDSSDHRPPPPPDRFDVTRGVVIATQGFDDAKKQHYLRQIMTSRPACVPPEVFDALPPDSERNFRCVAVGDKPDIYPRDIMYANTSFAELARWLYYGTRSVMSPRIKEGQRIPRISHMIWFSPSRDSPPSEMHFYQFLTVLSALYVGGFRHVYIHGNAGFRGNWWEKLSNENVTFVRLEPPEMIYQQRVDNIAHQSDVLRYAILHKYGGAYHDFEAMWTQRVPDWLLDYPCVVSPDWGAYGLFPEGINIGVMLAKRGAAWLRYNLASHRYYVDKDSIWNVVLMSYRTYERHPDQLFFYRHLQVMCDFGICHPSWEPGYRRNVEKDKRPTLPFDWRTETLNVHVTRPDPEASFLSPRTLKDGRDMFADIGRHILEKSGRLHLLDLK